MLALAKQPIAASPFSGIFEVMERYKNIAGNSGVIAYELRKDAIAVRFKNGVTYLYNYKIPGKESVERMKTLALLGKGLSTFISQHVRENYAAELQA